MTHNVIGQGTYGCIHSTSLLCNTGKLNSKDTISKVLLKTYGKEEIITNGMIDKIDKECKFHLGKPKKCAIKNSRSNKDAINKCRTSKYIDRNKITNNMLLLMKNGGINLDTFAIKIRDMSANEDTNNLMLRFWIEAHRLILGIDTFQKKDFIHHDIKPQNIVFNEKTMRLNYIDFGLSGSIKKYMSLSVIGRNGLATEWWSYPPEYKYMNRNEFNVRAKTIKRINKGDALNNTHVQGFLPYIVSHKERYKKDLEWLLKYGYQNYDLLLEKSFKTFDIYGLGFTFILILDSGRHLMDVSLWYDLHDLFYMTITPKYVDRIDSSTFLYEYENILEKHNVLHKFKVFL